VQHKLLGGERHKGVGAGIACSRRREDHRNERSKRSRIRDGSPRNEILDILALSRRENGEEKCCRRLSTIARSRDDAQRALSNPATTSFVAENRAPTTATNDLPRGTAAIGNRSSAGDQQNSGSIVESIVHRDQPIGIDDDFFRDLFCIERRVQRAPLFVATGSSDAAIKHAREHRARLRNLRQSLGHQLGDDVGRMLGFSGSDGRLGSVGSGENLSFGRADHHARLRAAPVYANNDLTQFQRSPSVGAGCVNDESMATPIVNDVPIRTYHGKAMWDNVVRKPVIDGKIGIICFANTTKLIAIIPTAMPRIASLWIARRHSMPRKKPPSNAP